jgi:hypothetical protein
VITFLSSLSFFVGTKTFIEKLMFSGLVYYALRYKDNVAASYVHGKFEIVATSKSSGKLV